MIDPEIYLIRLLFISLAFTVSMMSFMDSSINLNGKVFTAIVSVMILTLASGIVRK